MFEMLRANKSTFIKVPVRIWGFVVCPVRLLQATRGTVWIQAKTQSMRNGSRRNVRASGLNYCKVAALYSGVRSTLWKGIPIWLSSERWATEYWLRPFKDRWNVFMLCSKGQRVWSFLVNHVRNETRLYFYVSRLYIILLFFFNLYSIRQRNINFHIKIFETYSSHTFRFITFSDICLLYCMVFQDGWILYAKTNTNKRNKTLSLEALFSIKLSLKSIRSLGQLLTE